MNDCDLCKAERRTSWYYESDLCWIADCDTCGVPMVVYKQHVENPPDEHQFVMIKRLIEIADQEPFCGDFLVDFNQRKIKGHFHAHARSRRGWSIEEQNQQTCKRPAASNC